ncbi:MAG: hypothetical protein KDK62_08085 [Chlamydiia bacterium]|nr:hypothetical protein [Chlamydiia bacterium]
MSIRSSSEGVQPSDDPPPILLPSEIAGLSRDEISEIKQAFFAQKIAQKEDNLELIYSKGKKSLFKKDNDFFSVDFSDKSNIKIKKGFNFTEFERVKAPSWRKEYRRLNKEYGDKNKFIKFFFSVFITPFSATSKYLRFNRSSKEASRELDKLLQTVEPKDIKSFKKLLKRQAKLLESVDKASAQLLREAAERKDSLLNIENETLLACGYYDQDETFVPLLLHFYKDNGVLKMRMQILQQKDTPTVSEGEYEINPDKLSELLSALQKLSSLDEVSSENLSLKEKEFLNVLKSKAPSSKGSKEEIHRVTRPDQLIGDLVQIFGGKTIKEKETNKAMDSWSFVSKFLQSDPDAAASLKINLTLGLINEEMEFFLVGLRKVRPDQRLRLLEDFKSRVESLERNINYHFSDEGSFQSIADLEAMSVFKKRLDQMMKLAQEETKEQPASFDRGLARGFSASKKSRFNTKVKSHHVKETKETQKIVPRERYELELDALNKEFNYRNINILRVELNKLLNARRHSEALELSELILAAVPTPGSDNDYWKRQDNWDELDRLGEVISDVSKCQWEASLKTHQRHLLPDQIVISMNTRAALFAIARQKSHLAKKISADKRTPENRAAIAFDGFQPDFAQFIDILKNDPCYRLSTDPKVREKANKLLSYFEAQNGRVIRFDARVDANKELQINEQDYLKAVANALGREVVGSSINEDSVFMEIRRNPKKRGVLPNEIIDLRRDAVFFQIMYRPEFSLALSFKSSSMGVIGAYKWIQKLNKQASEMTDDQEKWPEIVRDLAVEQLMSQIDTMGRLDLQGGEYVVDGISVLQVASAKDSSNRLAYVPWGLGLPEEISSAFKESTDPLRARELVGDVPTAWLNAHLGKPHSSPIFYTKSSGKTPSTAGAVSQTEVGHLTDCLLEEGNAIDEFLMRTLNFTSERKPFTESSLIDVMDLIRVRPDLLEDPRIQRKVDLIFLEPRLVEKFLADNPEACRVFGEDLKKVIENKLELKRYDSAAFLMHIGAMFQDRTVPSFETRYHDEKSGTEYLKSALKEKGKDHTAIRLRYAEYLMNKLEKSGLSVEEKRFLVEVGPLLEFAARDTGTPVVNLALEAKLKNRFLPMLKAESQDELLNALLVARGIPAPQGSWKKVKDYEWVNGDYRIDLQTASIFVKGEKKGQQELVATIPKSIATKSDALFKLFGTYKILATVKNGNNPSETIYSFEQEGRNYELRFNKKSQTALLYQKIDGKWHQYQVISEGHHLIQEYGVWVNESNKKAAWMFVGNDAYKVVMNRSGEIVKVTSENNKHMVADPEDLLSHYFIMTHQNHMVFLRKPGQSRLSEIRFYDIGLKMSYENGNWELQNVVEGAKVLPQSQAKQSVSQASWEASQKFREAFGDDFSNLALQVIQPGQGVSFVIWPHAIKGGHVSQEGSTREATQKPPLTITFDSNGVAKGSSASFLHMAYIFAQKKDYRRAVHYLNLAKQNKLETPQDKKAFVEVSEIIHQMEPKTRRAMAWKLRAEIMILDINRQQLGQYHFQANDWGDYYQHLHSICDLFEQYEAKGKKPGNEVERDLLLSDGEHNQFRKLRDEGMRFFVEAYQRKQNQESRHVQQLAVKKIEERDLDADFVSTVVLLAKEAPISTLKSPSEISPRFILEHYIAYQNGIIDGTLNAADLQFLFKPLPTPRNQEEVYLTVQADKARRMLLQTSTYGAGGQKINLAELAEKRKHFPKRTDSGTSYIVKEVLRKKFKDGTPVDEAVSEIIELKVVKSTLESVRSSLVESLKTSNEALKEKKTFAPLKASVMPPKKRGQRLVDAEAIKDGLERMKGKGVLSQGEVDFLERASQEDLETVELSEALKICEAEAGVSLVEMRREQEITRSIAQVRTLLRSETLSDFSHKTIKPIDAVNLEPFFERFEQGRVDRLASLGVSSAQFFADRDVDAAIDRQENADLRAGIRHATQDLQQRTQMIRAVKEDQKAALNQLLLNKRSEYSAREVQLRREILAWAENSGKSIPRIQKMLRHPDLYSEQEVLDAILDCYQAQKKQDSPDLKVEEISDRITTYLLVATAIQQIDHAVKMDQPYETLVRGLNFQRYQQNGKLEHPEFSRKYLVAELRSGRILRDGQIKYIKELVENPEQWVSLRMGLGKTTFIMPIVAALLAERGYLPILLVTSHLKEMNLADFDRTTRRMIGSVGEPINFSADENVSAAYLAGQYLHLLEVKKNRGYFVTTVDSLANIKQLLVALSDQREERLKALEMLENQDNQDALQKAAFAHAAFEKKIYWLKKIDALLDGREGVDTVFVGDEVDSLFDITKEINRAVGQDQKPDTTVVNMTRRVFDTIFSSQHPIVQELADSLKHGNQAGYSQKEMREGFLLELAKEFLGTEGARYLVGLENTRPSSLSEYRGEDTQKEIAALKRLLSTTLPSIFSQESDINYGYSPEDGATIVPRSGKQSTPGNRFGDEYELVAQQYLGAIQMASCQTTTGESFQFLVSKLETFEERYPDKYRAMISDLGLGREVTKETLAQKLMEPRYFKYRMDLVEKMILDTGFIKRFNQQSTLSVQSVVTGRRVGGVTGTLSPYALPNYKPQAEGGDTHTRDVEAETLLQMAINHDQGLQTPCVTFQESKSLEHMHEIVSMPDAVAIINEGGYGMKGLSTEQWVIKLREASPDKSFIFIHSQERRPYLWIAGEPEPGPIVGQTLPKNYICLYGPADTRGTDLPILPGKTHYFPVRTTNLQEMGQSIWRGRGTGDRHTPIWHVPGDSISMGDAVVTIKQRSVEKQAQLNLKAELFRVQEIATHGVRKILFSPNPIQDTPDYWSEGSQDVVLSDIVVDQILFDIFRDFLIKNKGVNFETDYNPSVTISTESKILDTFDQERDKLYQKKREMAAKVEELSGINKDLVMPLFRLSESQLLKNLPSDLPPEKRNAIIRIHRAAQQLEEIRSQLKSEKEKFSKAQQIHKRNLPERVSQASAGAGGTQEQVQQQQQQQQQQAVRKKKTKQVDPNKKTHSFNSWNFFHIRRPSNNPDTFTPASVMLPQVQGLAGIYFTKEMEQVLNLMPSLQGDPIAKVCLNDNQEVIVISKLDFHEVIYPSSSSLAVFSPTEWGMRPVMNSQNTRIPLDKAAKIKFLLGFSKFTDEEKRAIQEWLTQLKTTGEYTHLKKWCDEKGVRLES